MSLTNIATTLENTEPTTSTTITRIGLKIKSKYRGEYERGGRGAIEKWLVEKAGVELGSKHDLEAFRLFDGALDDMGPELAEQPKPRSVEFPYSDAGRGAFSKTPARTRH